MFHRVVYRFALVVALCSCATGCRIPSLLRGAAPRPQSPTVFFGEPTLDQVIEVVNANTARVRQLQTTNASLSITGVPTLQCDIAVERPLRFRMTAGTRITGPELDLGSNDTVLWFWARRSEDPVVYFARHDEFRSSAAAEVMPVPPSWIIDAFGLVTLENNGSTSGPFPLGNGRLEIRTQTTDFGGTLNRSIVIDDQRGHVLEQRVFDGAGQLLATSIASDHYFDATTGATLPLQLDLQLPPAQMAFTIRASGYMVNQLSADGLQLWSMPEKAGHQTVDLGRLPSLAPSTGATVPSFDTSATPAPAGLSAPAFGQPTTSGSPFPTPGQSWSPQAASPVPSAGPPQAIGAPQVAGARIGSLSPSGSTMNAAADSRAADDGSSEDRVIRQQSWRRQFGWW